jgi:hypothetical protein
MKKIFSMFFCILSVVLFGQEKEITILDKDTRLPISLVNIFYKDLNEGVLTNADGMAKIRLKNYDLSFSCFNYSDTLISKEKIGSLNDTLWLTPKAIILEEVIVQNSNLKKKLKYVLDNYDDLYVDYPTEKECSIKETFLFDNTYKRLFSAKLKWWSKDFYFDFKKNPQEFTKLSIGKIDCNKISSVDLEFGEPGFAAIITKSMIPHFYLNTIISVLFKNMEQTNSFIENKDNTYTTISYSTNWITDKKGTEYQHTGKIIFDNETNAVVKLEDRFLYKEKKEQDKKTTKANKIATFYLNSNLLEYNFQKNKEGVWGIKYFNISLDGFLDYDSIQHPVTLSNSLYIVKETKVKKSTEKKLIDLNKPIYKNLPSETIFNSNTILLSEKEMEFVNAKK